MHSGKEHAAVRDPLNISEVRVSTRADETRHGLLKEQCRRARVRSST